MKCNSHINSITSASSRRVYHIIPLCLIIAEKIYHSGSRVFFNPPHPTSHSTCYCITSGRPCGPTYTLDRNYHWVSLSRTTRQWFCSFFWARLRITWSRLIGNIRLTTRHGRLVRSLLCFFFLTAEVLRGGGPIVKNFLHVFFRGKGKGRVVWFGSSCYSKNISMLRIWVYFVNIMRRDAFCRKNTH